MIGIIGAMDIEVKALVEMMTDCVRKEKAGMVFSEGRIAGRDVVVVKCGIGKVNAAVCAQILIDCFDADALINIGVAGSLDPALNIGDLVISKDTVHHDMDARNIGVPKGQVPEMPFLAFEADPYLIRLAEEANKKANPDTQVRIGRIVSGDIFVSSHELKEQLVSEFAGICAEMEGASVAHTAYLNQVPFVIIRAISDKADDSAEVDFPTFAVAAAEHSTRLVREMLEMWS